VLDVVVTGLFTIAIPALLRLTWRRNAACGYDFQERQVILQINASKRGSIVGRYS
jgi:hypothetical protein